MARVTLDKLAPGMQLQKPVLNLDGVLLLKAGETLTAKHIQIFSTWGVQDAEVVTAGQEEAAAPALSPEIRQAAAAEIARRFRRVNRADPVMAEIVRLATDRVAERLAAGDPSAASGGR